MLASHRIYRALTLISLGFLATMVVVPARSADLGGNCCADLEERVAELEATTARKGNRRVSLTISGQVSRVLFFDKVDTLGNTDNPNSPSRVRLDGLATINPIWSAGYVLEIRFPSPPNPNSVTGVEATPVLAQSAWWLEAKGFGRGTFGFTNEATDGIAEITLANTAVAALAGTGMDAGVRANVIRFDSTSLAGFTLHASASANDTLAAAVRYAGEVTGLRLALGVGYTHKPDSAVDPRATISGSASLMHVATGLFVSGAAGIKDASGAKANWHAHAGIERNWSGLGATTIYAEYAKSGGTDPLALAWGGHSALDARVLGFGVVQSIDAAAFDVFASVRRVETGLTDATVGMVGGRIRF